MRYRHLYTQAPRRQYVDRAVQQHIQLGQTFLFFRHLTIARLPAVQEGARHWEAKYRYLRSEKLITIPLATLVTRNPPSSLHHHRLCLDPPVSGVGRYRDGTRLCRVLKTPGFTHTASSNNRVLLPLFGGGTNSNPSTDLAVRPMRPAPCPHSPVSGAHRCWMREASGTNTEARPPSRSVTQLPPRLERSLPKPSTGLGA